MIENSMMIAGMVVAGFVLLLVFFVWWRSYLLEKEFKKEFRFRFHRRTGRYPCEELTGHIYTLSYLEDEETDWSDLIDMALSCEGILCGNNR